MFKKAMLDARLAADGVPYRSEFDDFYNFGEWETDLQAHQEVRKHAATRMVTIKRIGAVIILGLLIVAITLSYQLLWKKASWKKASTLSKTLVVTTVGGLCIASIVIWLMFRHAKKVNREKATPQITALATRRQRGQRGGDGGLGGGESGGSGFGGGEGGDEGGKSGLGSGERGGVQKGGARTIR